VDGMVQVYVPAGSFVMGSGAGQSEAQPAHTVTLSAYWIDQTEVTNAMYAQCVDAGQCEPPFHDDSKTHRSYFGDAAYDNYPVVWINWEKASAYCSWAGRRLPTEAEWEHAARGDDERTYPWGNDPLTCDLANYKGCTGDTAAVGSYPNGASPFGVMDMAGNAAEWANDWFGSYSSEAVVDPQGPTSGEYQILRGGSFFLIDKYLQSPYRLASFTIPGYSYYDSGFRCAVSASP
jgi:serine/threonine-protein kinase